MGKEETAIKAPLPTAAAEIIEQCFRDHFHNPQMAGNPIYNALHEFKEDLKRRFKEV